MGDGDRPTYFGKKLGEILSEKDISQTQLAQSLGTSRSYVSAISVGKKTVSASTVEDISDQLGLVDTQRASLHLAAAVDAGFKLELPDDF